MKVFLTPEEQDEIKLKLDLLQEECAETIVACSKMKRFGPSAHHPERTTTNQEELRSEMVDLYRRMREVGKCFDFDWWQIQREAYEPKVPPELIDASPAPK